jgi:hypothetical protein
MAIVPDKKLEQLQFVDKHITPWTTNYAAIGLTREVVAAVGAAADRARASYDAAAAARQASKSATMQADLDFKSMLDLVADAIKTIRLKAESTNDPSVYVKADIPAPAPRTDALPPTKPTSMQAVLGPDGSLTLQWKVEPSSEGFDASTTGVLFTVRRRLAGETRWTILGTAKPGKAGKRGFASFTDATLPPAPEGLRYSVQGVRSSSRGDLAGPVSNTFEVSLGGNGSTAAAPSRMIAGPSRMAA